MFGINKLSKRISEIEEKFYILDQDIKREKIKINEERAYALLEKYNLTLSVNRNYFLFLIEYKDKIIAQFSNDNGLIPYKQIIDWIEENKKLLEIINKDKINKHIIKKSKKSK